jgi:hypothetical protein
VKYWSVWLISGVVECCAAFIGVPALIALGIDVWTTFSHGGLKEPIFQHPDNLQKFAVWGILVGAVLVWIVVSAFCEVVKAVCRIEMNTRRLVELMEAQQAMKGEASRGKPSAELL